MFKLSPSSIETSNEIETYKFTALPATRVGAMIQRHSALFEYTVLVPEPSKMVPELDVKVWHVEPQPEQGVSKSCNAIFDVKVTRAMRVISDAAIKSNVPPDLENYLL
jgi:hypothetical protein